VSLSSGSYQVNSNEELPKSYCEPGHTAVFLLNLGAPSSSNVYDVRKYLKQFLSDPRVIDIYPIARWLLLRLIILPFRTPKSAKAYESIWGKNGSPLLINSKSLLYKVSIQLGWTFKVALGMRYGEPSIEQALNSLDLFKCKKLIILPLFPHYASASTGSAVEESMALLSKSTIITEVSICGDFLNHPGYISSLSSKIEQYSKDHHFDYLLMSYHGLPERQVLKSESTNRCNLSSACPKINSDNRYCYRAQCYETSRLLAEELCLPENKWGVSFQSRLGRIPWIKPYTDEELKRLRKIGIKKLAICCPSFVADCLETLEEIGIGAKEQWLEIGGDSLDLIPCLNDDDLWATTVVNIIKNN
jgi:protoporphyrin/coproporphyrin ferrochelatase